jgi:hypothetical protein
MQYYCHRKKLGGGAGNTASPTTHPCESFGNRPLKLMQYQASVNKFSQPLVQQLLDNADKLRLGIEKLENGCTLLSEFIRFLLFPSFWSLPN